MLLHFYNRDLIATLAGAGRRQVLAGLLHEAGVLCHAQSSLVVEISNGLAVSRIVKSQWITFVKFQYRPFG
jgi:hypothetical protein